MRFPVAASGDEPPAEHRFENFTATLLAPGVALVAYGIARPSEPRRGTNRSSFWVFADGLWQMRFHQGTPCAI